MAGNRFDEDDVYGGPTPRVPAGPPQVPISRGNRFEEEAVKEAPPPSTLLGNAADFTKAASNTFSMGMRDRLEGATDWLRGNAPSYSEGVNRAVADTAMRRERSPILSAAGDVAGGTAQAFVPGVGTAGRSISAGLGGTLPARIAGYGIEGGLLGAGQAAGGTYTGNPQDYANAALTGGAFGSLVGAPFGKFADVAPRSAAPIPNSAQLKESAGNRYTQTHAVPVEYSARNFWGGIDSLEQQLLRETNPVKSAALWETLRLARAGRAQAGQPGVTGATVSPKNIDDLRQQLTGIKEPGVGRARRWLDDYMQDPQGVVRGTDAQRAEIARLLNEARGDYRAGKRTQTIEETNQYAADRAQVANSGKNVANTYGQKLTNLLSPTSREGKWYNPEEKADIRATARRDKIEDFKRTLSNLGGGGGGMWGGSIGLGGLGGAYATGDLLPAAVGLGIPAASMALKSSSNRGMVREADALANRMAMNSPLYRSWAAQAPEVAGPGLGNVAESSRNAITNQLLNQLKIRGYMEPEGDPNAP